MRNRTQNVADKAARWAGVGLAVVLMLALPGCNPSEEDAFGEAAVAFGVRTEAEGEEPTTRAGQRDALTDTQLRATGFGVMAYYTGSKTWADYHATTLPAPNYMYNQHVTYDAGQTRWEYAPLKYWPNGAADRYLSFFAYAPYVPLTQDETDPAADAIPTDDVSLTAASRTGIVAMSGNAATGDPQLTYRLNIAAPTRQVDLLWGIRGQEGYQLADGTTDHAVLGAATRNTDLTKQSVEERVRFFFVHALASVDVYVQRVFDEPTPTGKVPAEETTRIFVSSLTLDEGRFYREGRFNLVDGTWNMLPAAKAEQSLTIGMGNIANGLRGTTGEAGAVQTIELNAFDTKPGVTEEPVPLTVNTPSLMFLPDGEAGIAVKPTITYSFVTRDDDLPMGLTDAAGAHRYARIQNTVTASDPITIGTEYEPGKYRIEAGKRYVLICYIGVEHVSFRQLAVEDWDFPLRFHLYDDNAFTPETDGWQDKGLTEE